MPELEKRGGGKHRAVTKTLEELLLKFWKGRDRIINRSGKGINRIGARVLVSRTKTNREKKSMGCFFVLWLRVKLVGNYRKNAFALSGKKDGVFSYGEIEKRGKRCHTGGEKLGEDECGRSTT